MPTLYTILRAKHRPAYAPPPRFKRPGDLKRPPLVRKGAKRIAVVGAGLAGLCAAFELQRMGYLVTVFEARNRVGGRVNSDRTFSPGKVVERGAELIGSNHSLWRAYAAEFGLRFSKTKEYKNGSTRMDGRTLSFEESATLLDAIEAFQEKLNSLAETIVDPYEPWATPHAKKMDHENLARWLSKQDIDGDDQGLGRRAIEEQLVADNGVEAAKQSLLAVAAMIKGHGLQAYWDGTEDYRCVGGNEKLAEAFRKCLRGAVRKNSLVTSIANSAGRVTLTVEKQDPTGKKTRLAVKTFDADDVILAVPPSVWNLITFTDKALRKRLRRPPAMGCNTKGLMRFHRRFWEDFSSSPQLANDGIPDMTWETSEANRDGDPDFTLVAFAGARHARKLLRLRNDRARRAALVKALEPVYPGIGRKMKKFEFPNWLTDNYSRGSYYFPRPGEVMEWGRFWKNGYEDWLHFAGEHTCYAFMGYMEGALNSGYRLARRIAERDKILK